MPDEITVRMYTRALLAYWRKDWPAIAGIRGCTRFSKILPSASRASGARMRWWRFGGEREKEYAPG